jgi:lipoyl synthase
MKGRKPDWLKIKVRSNDELNNVQEILKRLSLNTVCEEANCPNRMECFSRRTATFMILGRMCTRNCTFCNVTKGSPEPVDADEPLHVAQAVHELGLKHTVITSVTRDDLPDGGSEHFAKVIKEIRKIDKKVKIEVLIPDFKGDEKVLQIVVDALPDIINHNVETVPGLYPEVRPMAVYERSLELLRNIKGMNPAIYTKSGLMLGLGEKERDVIKVFEDLRGISCDFITIGQYLAPSKQHHPIIEYVHPDVFARYESICREMGFSYVASGPFVRSSYHAEEALGKSVKCKRQHTTAQI